MLHNLMKYNICAHSIDRNTEDLVFGSSTIL